MIEILTCNGPATVQDLGRPGYRHLGVPLSGALDPNLLRLANALANNPPDAAAIELRLVGPQLRTDTPILVALAGGMSGRIESEDGQVRPAAAWSSHQLQKGDTLSLGAIGGGVAYLAVSGGIEVPRVLGSRATYARARMGGLEGRQLGNGDRLIVGADNTARRELRLPTALYPPPLDDSPLRVLPGPQQDCFTAEAWSIFLGEEFTVSREADRMGLRLNGPRLEHLSSKGADIVSDAVTPGAIQIPADGRPIILLADCQTVGGYPKIATVISADLPRLAHALPGSHLRFNAVTLAEAQTARIAAASMLEAMIQSLVPASVELDLTALYQANLIDGVIHEN
jgi:biotin-dependent carboxylase-like uncharacterized protein